MVNEAEDLQPISCPLCPSANVRIGCCGGCWTVSCQDCGASTGNRLSEEAAVESWNTRRVGTCALENDPLIVALREVARLSNLYLSDGCCEQHHREVWNKLIDELHKFEDDTFTTLKDVPAQ